MRKVLSVVAVSILVSALATLMPSTSDRAVAAQRAATLPNIIVILTDDQRVETLQTMPAVRQQLRAQGADFLGVIPTSVCCPSRTSILTGNLAHTTGVYTNSLDFGGWPTFNASGFEEQTFAVALHDAGYRTGLFGKYLNYWNLAPDGFVPPGWDVFEAIHQPEGEGPGSYYVYELRGTGPPRSYGRDPADYSTSVIKRRSLSFIETTPPNVPYMAFISLTAPHFPYTSPARDVGSYIPKEPYDNPGVNELDMSDKPSFMQDEPEVSRENIDRDQIGTGEVLRSVNRLVRSVLSVADMSNTLVIYTSDNGLMWGDHRTEFKYRPYRWATEVPMFMRWDGVIAPGTGGLVANIDIAPTVLEAAGIPDALTMEGESVLDGTRESVLIEGVQRADRPAYCGVRSQQYLFVQYSNGEGELYDYSVDPFELENKIGDPGYADVRQSLRQEAMDLCVPTPPNFTWTPLT